MSFLAKNRHTQRSTTNKSINPKLIKASRVVAFSLKLPIPPTSTPTPTQPFSLLTCNMLRHIHRGSSHFHLYIPFPPLYSSAKAVQMSRFFVVCLRVLEQFLLEGEKTRRDMRLVLIHYKIWVVIRGHARGMHMHTCTHFFIRVKLNAPIKLSDTSERE